MASQAGILAGEAIGGILVAQTSPIWVMVINAVSFVFSAFCIWRMRREYRPPGVSSTGNKGYKKLWMEMKEGFHYIRLLPAVIFCYVMMMLIRATLYAINVLLPPFSRDVLKIGAQGFGYIDACFALGAIAGNLFLPWCTRVWGNHAVMVSGMAGIGACLFLFAAVHGLPIAMLVYFLLGIAFQVGVLYFTSAQKEIAVQYQGRVHSNFNTLFAASSLAVYLLMGHLADAISMRRLYIFQGSIMLTGALAAAMWLYRRPPVAAGKQQEKYAA
jgi:predicted MFS family arabinose efflux permease